MALDKVQLWLRICMIFYVIMGVGMAMAAVPGLGWPMFVLGDLLTWPVNGHDGFDRMEVRWLSAIGGGVLAGWGVLIGLTARHFLPLAPVEGRRVLLTSVWVWFVLDGVGSVAAGVPFNVTGNLVFLALVQVPLWRPIAGPG